MRSTGFSRLLYMTVLLVSVFAKVSASPIVPTEDVSGLLPEAIGEFRARGPVVEVSKNFFGQANPEDFGVVSAAERAYVSKSGQTFWVTVARARRDSGAFALLTAKAVQASPPTAVKPDNSWTAGFELGDVLFFKGPIIVNVRGAAREARNRESVLAFARQFADTLDRGENEIPVLVKHLPEAETAQERAVFAVSLPALQQAAGQRPVLEAVSFEGGAEAVTAQYGPSRLVIVENTTPQLATVNDTRINARLKELKDAGQPVPTAYRRVGNYAVFVFDAPDEATAAKLIDAIKYEQVVQWLGDNPNDLRRAQRHYTETTAGIILAVLKASGISLLVCLGVGAIFGGIIFKRRRQQQTVAEAFSDAGGMLRLNLDKMTPPIDPNKLLGRGEQR